MSENPVRLHEKTRNDLRGLAEELDGTYSDALLEILPEDEELDRGEAKMIVVSDEANERLESVTGEGVDREDAIIHYLNEHE